MKDLLERKGGGEILRKAVSGMLPKNRLRKLRLDRLRCFEDGKNPYADNILARWDEQISAEFAKAAEQEKKN